jgi:formylglycine-generating enzyme required for sulfatase activity
LLGAASKPTCIPTYGPAPTALLSAKKGSRSLTKLIRQLAKNHDGVHVIGHSHGGNVANDAATMLNWSHNQKRPKLASVTTVGTPFFRTQVTRGEALGAWAFGAMALISTIVLVPALLTVALLFLTDPTLFTEAASQAGDAVQRAEDRQSRTIFLTLLTAAIASAVALVFIFPLAFRGLARIRRAGRRAKTDTAIFAIRHPEDEPISFLRRVEGMPIEPFPRWSVLRGSRTAAIVWGIRAVLALPLIGLFLIVTEIALSLSGRSYDLPPFFGTAFGTETNLAFFGTMVVAFGLAAAPIIFGVVYVIYRLIAGTAGEFGFRGALNGVVAGALRGIAFGRDGDNRIGDVSTTSHYYATRSLLLGGDLAARMAVDANDASRRLFDKYRRGIFSADADQNDFLNEIASDALTWDSLVHTLYFDQPEVVAACSDYIASVVHGADPAGVETLRAAEMHEAPKPARGKLLVPALSAAVGLALALFLVGGAVVWGTPWWNRDHLSRQAFVAMSHPTHAPGDVIVDCDGCPELMVIGGGVFTMGTPTTELFHLADEGPLRRVTIRPFAAGKYEVTFAEWDACVDAGSCAHDPEDGGWGRGLRPVINVGWADAQQYVRWLSERTGQNYRLLSEAEWEYAARAGSPVMYGWGDADPTCDRAASNGARFGYDIAASAANALDDGCSESGTQDVGGYLPNAFGLHDMAGNVSEWVQDCYTYSYARHPSDGSAYSAACDNSYSVRGGGWDSYSWQLRPSNRDFWFTDARLNNLGFRVARDL